MEISDYRQKETESVTGTGLSRRPGSLSHRATNLSTHVTHSRLCRVSANPPKPISKRYPGYIFNDAGLLTAEITVFVFTRGLPFVQCKSDAWRSVCYHRLLRHEAAYRNTGNNTISYTK